MTETAEVTAEQKLDAVIEFLTTSHLDMNGGYPYAYDWIGNMLAVAGLSYDGATTLDTYGRADLVAWYDRAALMAAEDSAAPDEQAGAYFYETGETRS